MIKLDLYKATDEFDIISSETSLFYNVKTGEFEWHNEDMEMEDDDFEKYEGDEWIAAPSQWDINEYSIIKDFVNTVPDLHKNELLSVAIEGRGAFCVLGQAIQ